jgi:hypothetical protein
MGLTGKETEVAVCRYCNVEMTLADGCTEDPIIIEGDTYRPIRLGDEPGPPWSERRCGDCNVRRGRVHHHGCDVERCPACGLQSISCDCIWAGEELRREEWIEDLEERFLLASGDE